MVTEHGRAIQVSPPMNPVSRLTAAAQVLAMDGLLHKDIAALTAQAILANLLENVLKPTPAELVNGLADVIWTYRAGIAAVPRDADYATYNDVESVAAAVRCFYNDDRYVKRFKELWKQRFETGKPVRD